MTRRLTLAALLAGLVLWTALVASLASQSDRVLWRNISPFVWLFSGVPVEATYIPTPVQSVQAATATFAGATTTATATLGTTLKSAANAVLIWDGLSSGANSGLYSPAAWVSGTITNTTTITATSQGAPRNGDYYRGEVVEFLAFFVKSSGCGSISIANGSNSNTATITSVNTAKAIVALTGMTANSTVTLDGAHSIEPNVQADVTLTNATTITANWKYDSTNSVPQSRTVGYCYVEFK